MYFQAYICSWLITVGKAQVYLQILYLFLAYQCKGELSGLYLHLADRYRRDQCVL